MSATSELSQEYKAFREHRRDTKLENYERSMQLLKDSQIKFEKLSDNHVRIGDFDFWPTTGTFMHRRTKKRGYGILNLLENFNFGRLFG